MQMLAEERFSLIMEQLDRKRTVTVQELCEALNTSESTCLLYTSPSPRD